MHRSLWLAAFALLLVVTPAARAATPVQLATNGAYPVIAVGPDGAGHVAWELRPDGKDVAYCRIPAGGTSCTPQTLTGVSLAAGGAGALNIFAPTASKIVIEASVTGCGSGALYGLEQWVSTDGGASFGTGVCRTTSSSAKVVPTRGKNYFDNSGDRFIAAGGAASGRYLLATPAGVGQVTTSQDTNPIFTTGNYYDVAVGAGGAGAGSFLVAAAYSQESSNAGIRYSVFNQPFLAATAAAINNPANWTKDLVMAGGEKTIDPPNVVSGPSGVYLVYQDENEALNDRIAVAKFQPDALNLANSRFASPVLVDGTADDAAQSLADAAEDQDGRVHLIWNGGNRIRYAVSSDGGASFQTLGTLLADASPTTKDFAAGPGGKGWMVYVSDSTTVKLIPLEPSADPLPPTGGGTTPISAPAPSAPGTRRVTSTVPGATITFGVPNACVQPGSTFKVTLSWKRKKKKGNKFVKVTRADFSIGTKVVKKDKKAPFVQTLKVTASARRGSTINLRARAFIKVKKGKAPKKSIKAQIKVCP